jgi:ATP-dependent DNA helicase RecQ
LYNKKERIKDTMKDYSSPTRQILSLIVASRSRSPKEMIVRTLFGSKSKKIIESRLNKQLEYGAFLSEIVSQEETILLIDELVSLGFLYENRLNHSMFLTLSHEGIHFMMDNQTLLLDLKKLQSVESDLSIRLRNLRKKLALRYEVSPFLVFDNKTLQQLELQQPHTKEEFLAINGLGEKKWKQFGI